MKLLKIASLMLAISLPAVLLADSPAPESSDDWIAFKINARLLVRSNVSAFNTQIEVKKGLVTLTGKAESAAQKELTENYVRDIEGVKGVDNKLVIADKSADTRTAGDVVDDASITAQVKYALLTHESTGVLKTKIVTRDGRVAIEGQAANDAEKALVTRLAKGVRGVKSVNNKMIVKG